MHFQKRAASAAITLRSLCSLSSPAKGLTLQNVRHLVQLVLRPRLLYGASIFSLLKLTLPHRNLPPVSSSACHPMATRSCNYTHTAIRLCGYSNAHPYGDTPLRLQQCTPLRRYAQMDMIRQVGMVAMASGFISYISIYVSISVYI